MKKNKNNWKLTLIVCAAALVIAAVGVIHYEKRKDVFTNNLTQAYMQQPATSAPESEYPNYTVLGNDFVTIYQEADSNSEEINKVYPGSVVEFLEKKQNGYSYIRGKGSAVKGYILSSMIQPVEFIYSLAPLNIVDVDSSLYSYEEMCVDIEQITKTFPQIVKSEVLSKTADDRTIYQLKLGNPDAPKKVLIYAGVAGSEYMTTQLLMKQLEYYAYYYYDGSYNSIKYSDFFDNVCFVLLPMVNPDGVAISQSGAEAIRNDELRKKIANTFFTDRDEGLFKAPRTTYFTNWRANARGVDINKNFSSDWDIASPVPHMSYAKYKGESPESEAETQALKQLIEKNEFSAAVGYTVSGPGIIWDLGSAASKAYTNAAGTIAWELSHITTYPHTIKMNPIDYSGSFQYWIAANYGVPSICVAISDKEPPLVIDDLQAPWVKTRELWAGLAHIIHKI